MGFNNILWLDYLSYKVFNDSIDKKRNVQQQNQTSFILCTTSNISSNYFPAIFLDDSGTILIENNPKIMAALIAALIGIFSRSIIATIFSGLASYWFLIFVV